MFSPSNTFYIPNRIRANSKMSKDDKNIPIYAPQFFFHGTTHFYNCVQPGNYDLKPENRNLSHEPVAGPSNNFFGVPALERSSVADADVKKEVTFSTPKDGACNRPNFLVSPMYPQESSSLSQSQGIMDASKPQLNSSDGSMDQRTSATSGHKSEPSERVCPNITSWAVDGW